MDHGLHDRAVRLVAFVEFKPSEDAVLYQGISPTCDDDDVSLLIIESSPLICDKVIHGIVAFISSQGFEMLMGRVMTSRSRISHPGSSVEFDSSGNSAHSFGRDFQIFTAVFKRPPPKTSSISFKPIRELVFPIESRLLELKTARWADSQMCLCSEDLAGIKELVLLPSERDPRLTNSNDYPMSRSEYRLNRRLHSQPIQGFGHRPFGQFIHPRRYKLVIVGVNQAGFLSFVHTTLLLSHFRIIEAEIETMRGSYAHNTYIIETFSPSAERLLRAHFQCVVPVRSEVISDRPFPFHHEVPLRGEVDCGVWLEDGLASFYGRFVDGVKQGFGRFWRCADRQALAGYTYEGDWVLGMQTGYGFKLEADEENKGVVSYSFGKLLNGKLIDGCVLCPFEPPGRSVRIDPSVQPDQCVYRVLIQRAEYWRRQLPRTERPASYLPVAKLRDYYACNCRSAWTLFSESPVPATSSITCWQVAAIFEMCGLPEAAKTAFAKRIDGGLLEAMNEDHLRDIIGLSDESQRCMFIQFMSTLARAHNIDRHMRQPVSVLDPLINPSIGSRLLPLDRMRVVESLGTGAYGKVMYAEFLAPSVASQLQKTTSMASLAASETNMSLSRAGTPPHHPAGTMTRAPSDPSLFSALTRRSMRGGSPSAEHVYVALKEQVGSSAQLENSCELIREWATLNALPHENIVKLEGICADTNAPLFNKRYLATALVEASLPSLIYNADGYGPAPDLTPLLTIQLAGDIASGLGHMHSLNLLHGDIKSPNVLVDLKTKDRPIARLCDLGHAAIRIGPRPQRRMCTFGWASPESLRDAETDTSADVWSWAVVCWEMYVKQMPWKGCTHAQMVLAVGYCGLPPSGQKGLHIPERVRAERKMGILCRQCWQLDPLQRPSMDRILHVVDKLGRISVNQAVVELQSLLQ